MKGKFTLMGKSSQSKHSSELFDIMVHIGLVVQGIEGLKKEHLMKIDGDSERAFSRSHC